MKLWFALSSIYKLINELHPESASKLFFMMLIYITIVILAYILLRAFRSTKSGKEESN